MEKFTTIELKPTQVEDLERLFVFQLDEEGRHLAAFMGKDSDNKEAYVAKFTKLMSEPTVNNQTITVDGELVGSIAKFEMEGDAEITYWIDKSAWGKGIASAALKQFLTKEAARPLYGRTAFDNVASQRVLEKCGFVRVGQDRGFASARQAEIEEYIYKLD